MPNMIKLKNENILKISIKDTSNMLYIIKFFTLKNMRV